MTGKAQHFGKWIDLEVPVWMGAEHVKNLMSNTHVPQIILDGETYYVNTIGLFDRYKAEKKDVRMYTELSYD